MRLYEQLFYSNTERFLAASFRIAKKVLGEAPWHELVRAFYDRHPSRSPYFREINQEFLKFLDADEGLDLPDFLLELCHYEWVEMALQVVEDPAPDPTLDPSGDLLALQVVVSPSAWPLTYRYRVQDIGPSHVPQSPPSEPTFLIARRRADGRVKFIASNSLTHRLLALVQQEMSGGLALDALAGELPQIDRTRLEAEGAAMLKRLRRLGVLLGARRAPASPRQPPD